MNEQNCEAGIKGGQCLDQVGELEHNYCLQNEYGPRQTDRL